MTQFSLVIYLVLVNFDDGTRLERLPNVDSNHDARLERVLQLSHQPCCFENFRVQDFWT